MSSTITSNYAVLFGNADGMGNNIFSNNQVISSGFGVEMTYGGNNTITCNTIAASQGYAIVVTSSWTMVENNKVSGDGSGDGILINGDAHFSIIGNTANDFADGIHVVSGPYGKVVANTCINNGVGYELEADNTIMASNDFISNTTPTSLHGHSTVAQLP
jgi:parallel beta-helix repeat protein